MVTVQGGTAQQCREQHALAAIQALRSSAESYATFAQNTSPQYAHITPEERETIAKEATSALIWLGR
eukprot:954897-Pelagomonas_calceolata.AAC.1